MGPVNLPSVIVDANTRINMQTENWRMMSPTLASNSERVVRDYSPQFKDDRVVEYFRDLWYRLAELKFMDKGITNMF